MVKWVKLSKLIIRPIIKNNKNGGSTPLFTRYMGKTVKISIFVKNEVQNGQISPPNLTLIWLNECNYES